MQRFYSRKPSSLLAIGACLFLLAHFTANTACASIKSATIFIANYDDGEVLRYSTPFLQGQIANTNLINVVVTNLSSKRATRDMIGAADHGRFKVLTELVPGVNNLELKAGNDICQFKLEYKPQTNPRFIRAVLFTDNTGDTKYSTPLPNDTQDYKGKFDTILKIMQSFTADWMQQYGYGRRTFNLELDDQGKVIVHVVKGKREADWYRYHMDRGGLYGNIAQETEAALPNVGSVNCTLISFSSMDPVTHQSVAYTALGGYPLALFGGACMYSFPNSLADVQKAFTNATLIDHNKYVSDSVDRFTFWGTASTSIGAMLHEMGHSMGLPHSDDPRDIMTRGIDNFGRYWVFYDPPSARNSKPIYFKENEVGYWSPVSAAALAPTEWFQLDKGPPQAEEAATTVELSPDGNEFTIKNPHGLGFIGFERPGAAHSFFKIDLTAPLPKEVHIPAQQVFSSVGKDQSQFRIIDGDARMSTFNLNEFGWAFVRKWHFFDHTEAWQNHGEYPDVSAAKLKEIFAAAIAKPLTAATSGEVRMPNSGSEYRNTASYAAVIMQSPSQQTIKIYTGSHDSLRIWVNGKLVTQVLAVRKAAPDTESNQAMLERGPNQVLVEVSHGDGAGQFYFRMTAADGNALRLKDDGTLVEIKTPELMH